MEIYSSETENEEDKQLKTMDLSYKLLDNESLYYDLENLIRTENEPGRVWRLNISNNVLTEVPQNIIKFCNLRKIDLSSNNLIKLPEDLIRLPLKTLIARNNSLNDSSFPKTLDRLEHTLEELNLSGNNLTVFPEQIFRLVKLKYLNVGQNSIREISSNINALTRLEILSLGGNMLHEVPKSLCQLQELQALILSDNELEILPACIANLMKLRTLQLHRNKLKALPTEIVTLKYLSELSLRENPLVNKFINDMIYDPPTLMEVSARVIKQHKIKYSSEELPLNLYHYLESAHHCVNPKCRGVYFDNRVEHIKFVDFCGKYRVPLLQYLCSSKCIDYTSTSDDDSDNASTSNDNLMRKVLLG